mgnify:CR=1 FL=1
MLDEHKQSEYREAIEHPAYQKQTDGSVIIYAKPLSHQIGEPLGSMGHLLNWLGSTTAIPIKVESGPGSGYPSSRHGQREYYNWDGRPRPTHRGRY